MPSSNSSKLLLAAPKREKPCELELAGLFHVLAPPQLDGARRTLRALGCYAFASGDGVV